MKNSFTNLENHEIFDALCSVKSKVVNPMLKQDVSCLSKSKISELSINRIQSASNAYLAQFDWRKIFSNDGWRCILQYALIFQNDDPTFCIKELEIIKEHFSSEIEVIQKVTEIKVPSYTNN